MQQDNNIILSYSYTNTVRGIAALIIIICHLLIHWNISRIFNLPGSVAVSAFLFLSGYGINESYKKHGLKKFWIKKINKIIIPFYLYYTVLTLLRNNYDTNTFIHEITFTKNEFWYIAFLIKSYLFYWISRKIFPQHTLIILTLFGIISLNIFKHIEAEQSFCFLLGVITSEKKGIIKQSPQNIKYYLIGGIIIGITFLLLKEIPTIHQYKGTLLYNYILVMIKFPLAIVIILMPYYFNILIKNKFIHICGIASLELYLVHLPISFNTDMTIGSITLFIIETTILTYIFYHINQIIKTCTTISK